MVNVQLAFGEGVYSSFVHVLFAGAKDGQKIETQLPLSPVKDTPIRDPIQEAASTVFMRELDLSESTVCTSMVKTLAANVTCGLDATLQANTCSGHRVSVARGFRSRRLQNRRA